jgi:hypothetical protein
MRNKINWMNFLGADYNMPANANPTEEEKARAEKLHADWYEALPNMQEFKKRESSCFECRHRYVEGNNASCGVLGLQPQDVEGCIHYEHNTNIQS